MIPCAVVVKKAMFAVRLEKTVSRTTGSGATNRSYKPKPMTPAAPRIRGTSVRQDDHEYMMPPQVRGMRKDAKLATNRVDPTQSMRRSFKAILEGTTLRRRKSGTITTDMPIKGKLIQKIHLH